MEELEQEKTTESAPRQTALNMTIIGLVGQVGCLTLLILLASVFIGLWLDTQFGTRPWITIGMLVASIPIALVVMFFVTRKTTDKFKKEFEARQKERLQKEDAIGRDS